MAAWYELHYPLVYETGQPALMDDKDLIALIRERCGDSVAEFVEQKIGYGLNVETLKETLEEVISFQRAISDLDDAADGLQKKLEALLNAE